MARVKLRRIMECPGLQSSYREKGLLLIAVQCYLKMLPIRKRSESLFC